MPLSEVVNQRYDVYTDFLGGMNCILGSHAPNQYFSSRNIEIRGGKAETRRGVKRSYPENISGVEVGFYFNQENAFYNDATHTGFWFPFKFIRSAFGGNIQAFAVVKDAAWERERLLFVADGVVLQLDEVYAQAVTTSEAIGSDETITLVQAGNRVFMFRGEDDTTLVWDFSSNGFQPVESADDDFDDIPNARGAVYFLGRLWAWLDDDDIAASDILAFNNWDLGQNLFSINYGSGQKIKALIPFGSDTLIVAKDYSMHALTGADSDDLTTLRKRTLNSKNGLVGKNAWVVVGDDLWFLSRDGVRTINRNQFDELQTTGIIVSTPIQMIINRINFDQADKICMGYYDNYVLMGLPLDDSEKINAIAVFDDLLKVWVGVWDGTPINPNYFFKFRDDYRFMGEDGVVRTMFVAGFDKDSDDTYNDTPEYEADGTYYPGDYVRYENAVYVNILHTPTFSTSSAGPTYHLPTDSTYWTQVTGANLRNLYSIETELITRYFRHGDPSSGKRTGKGVLDLEQQNAVVSLVLESEFPYTENTVFINYRKSVNFFLYKSCSYTLHSLIKQCRFYIYSHYILSLYSFRTLFVKFFHYF